VYMHIMQLHSYLAFQTENPRRLILSLSRTGGSLDVITIFYNVDYVEQGELAVSASGNASQSGASVVLQRPFFRQTC
jgi:hypothetical protein